MEFICRINQVHLPFVSKKRFLGWNVKWNGSTRWKFPGIEGMPLKVFLFFGFNWNDRDKLYHWQKSHPCHSLVAPCKRIGNPESSKVLLLESGIQRLESGIHNGLESGIHCFGIRIQKVGIRNPDAGIRNPGPSWILLHGATLAHGRWLCEPWH